MVDKNLRDANAGGQRELPSLYLVDDDPSVLRATTRLCASTFEVSSSTLATDLLAELVAGNRFDVVLSDVDMPVMSGVALHKALEKEFPAQLPRILFWSGGADEEARTYFRERNTRILPKTMDRLELLGELHWIIQTYGRV